MADRKEKAAPWLSVPQFGDWEQKGDQVPDYSVDFSKIRENRKQHKRDMSRASIGNEEELMTSSATPTNTSHSHAREENHQFSEPNPCPTLSFRTKFGTWVEAFVKKNFNDLANVERSVDSKNKY